MNKNVKSKTKTSLIWDLSGAFARQFAFLFISIILARLLSPVEFGIIGISMIFISISEVFTDAGFTSGLVQQKETKDITYSSVFYLNLFISLILSGLIVMIAPMIAEFYEEQKVKSIIIYLSVIPPISALGRVQATILTKKLNFKSLTIRNLGAIILGGIVGVLFAYLGYGVYALVAQQITMAIVATLLLWLSAGWVPKLEFSLVEVKKLLGFSVYVFLDNLLRQVFNKVDTMFIGKVFSPAMLGFYSRAESLKTQVQTYTTNSLRKVIFPVLSALQNDEKGFERTYFKVFDVVTGLIVLLIAPIYFLSHEVIIFLLGNKWEPSVILFQILIFSALTSPQIGMMGKAVLAKGYSKLKFNMGLLQRLLKLLPICVGFYFGIEEFAIAVVVASTLVFFVNAIIIQFKLKFNFWRQVKKLIVPNLIFLIFIFVDFVIGENTNNWVVTILFLVIHLIYMKFIKHKSYSFIVSNLNSIVVSLRKMKSN